ncbi:hypothetical protein AXF42_Ash005357 [Apostasia shenzhenica]|uniref:3'-5' exonuclease domain-containing protein n=1 Tax=Apostasia shenzhenica TaxID=1088818 RepID=A0A2I0B6Q6_9ASPA|nr:hypothetical protein AXF42_Ash005357 [Apostasia shenzhenica]
MASDAPSPLLRTRIPTPGEPLPDENSEGPLAPIHVVKHASELPSGFLNPSFGSPLVIGLDCEGIELCRHGAICVIQLLVNLIASSALLISVTLTALVNNLIPIAPRKTPWWSRGTAIAPLAFPDAIYLVDAIEGGEALVQACKGSLESNFITKVIHDCKRDSEALYFQYGIKLHNVVDTQIAYSLIEEQEGRNRSPNDYISLVSLLADTRYCGTFSQMLSKFASCSGVEVDFQSGVAYPEKEKIRCLLRQDRNFWTYRPLSEQMIRTAADDVRFLLYIYHKMMEKLNKRSRWHLAIRGCLYCRCFCLSGNSHADWPALPRFPCSHVSMQLIFTTNSTAN